MSNLITKGYKNELAQMHKGGFGDSAGKWKHCVNELLRVYDCKSILDYGCGQAVLRNHMPTGIRYQGYDPAGNKALSKMPRSADLVIAIDVLEHIEPLLLTSVLVHINECIDKVALFVIAQRPATQILSDGRNAHLIQQGPEWWYEKINILMKQLNPCTKVTRQFGMSIKKDLVFLLERI